MIWFVVTIAICTAIVAVCKTLFGIHALRGVPVSRRSEVIHAIGDAWHRWLR